MHGHALNVLNVSGAQQEARDGSRQAKSTHDLPHGFLAGRGHGSPQRFSVGAGDGLGDLRQIEAVAHQVNDLTGQLSGAVVSTGHDRGVHAPVVGHDVLKVIVGDQEDLEFTIRHGESHERQVAEVPALLLSGQLGEERAVSLSKLEVAQVHALQGGQKRHGRRGGAANLDDTGGSRFHGRATVLLGGPHLAQRRIALGQVVGARIADAHLGIEEDGELVSQFSGRRAGDNLGRVGGHGSNALLIDSNVETQQLRRGGEPLELREDRTFLQLSGNHAGVQIVADNHAFNASPVLGHVTTFLSVVTSSHHSMVPLCRVGRYFARPRGQLRDFVLLRPAPLDHREAGGRRGGAKACS